MGSKILSLKKMSRNFAGVVIMLVVHCYSVNGEDTNTLDSDFLSSVTKNETFIAGIKSLSREDCERVPDDWQPSYNWSKLFQLYLSGYDDMDRPIWIAETGTWDIRSVVEQGEEAVKDFETYMLKYCKKLFPYLKPSPESPDGEAWAILDNSGLNIRQFTSPQTVILGLRLGLAYREMFTKHVTGMLGINLNYAGQLLYNLARPFAGTALDRIELLGSRPERFVPQLLNRFPKDQLPPWYGGGPGFKPVAVFPRDAK